MRPEHIFVNQAGYKPGAKKQAVLTISADAFEVISEDGSVCFRGRVEKFGYDKNSGDKVYLADFSEWQKAGNYKVRAAGEESLTFTISENVFDDVLHDTMKAYYFLRCGMELEAEYAGVYIHAKCHHKEAVLWEDHGISMEVNGGWHDAGDYGRYVTAGACAVAHLLYAYKMFPEKLQGLYLNIPESGKTATPDFLSEIRYELEWFLKMQRDDGAVYHKATTKEHADFVMPQEDVNQMYILPVSSIATADFAAVCALASGFYREYDEAFADRLMEAAKKSGFWLEENPQFVAFHNPEGCHTGEYSEYTDRDNRFWAWAELFAATGDEHYHEMMQKALKEKMYLAELGYYYVAGFGTLAYVLCDRDNRKQSILDRLKNVFPKEAYKLANIADKCGYGVAMKPEQYCWGSNMNVMKNGMIFAIADYLTGEDTYKSYAQAQVDYLLGVNALGYSYVTGTGEFCYNYPHLRPAHADGIETCMPGMVSGGPNRYPGDEKATQLVPKGTPPMKCFVDHVDCYSLNEITIYWNSPTVFTLAYLA